MARARWKLSYFSAGIWRKIKFLKKNNYVKRRIFYDRSSTIPSCFYFNIIRVHKGKRYRRLLSTRYIVGKKFGEFSFTRKPYHFPPKKSKKKKSLNRR